MLGQKDADLLVLESLDDRTLLNMCLVNKAYVNLCNNQPFWYNRYVQKFGEKGTKYKPADRSWKDNYLKTIIDLDRFSNDPDKFLKHISWAPAGPEESSYRELSPDEREVILNVPFLESPEWVMNNFYLLDLGPAYIEGKMVEHVTPEMLMVSEAIGLSPNMRVNGFAYTRTDWWKYPT